MSSPDVLAISPHARCSASASSSTWLQSPRVAAPRLQRRRRLGVSRVRRHRGRGRRALSRGDRTQRVVPGRAMADRARRRCARRHSGARGRHARDGRPALRRQSHESLLLLQIRALVRARARARRARDRDRSSTARMPTISPIIAPGKKAATEQGIRSPLAELGFTKSEIRELSRARGIPTWSQPSSPCLSSRLPYGTPVTVTRLSAIERAERALRALGVTGNLRVRHHGDTARIEMDLAELALLERARSRREASPSAVRAAGFASVVLDPRGFRSGSLNVLAGIVAHSGDQCASFWRLSSVRASGRRFARRPRQCEKPLPKRPGCREDNLHLSIKFFGEQPDTAPAEHRPESSPQSRPRISRSTSESAGWAHFQTFGRLASYGWACNTIRGSSSCITTSRRPAPRTASRSTRAPFVRTSRSRACATRCRSPMRARSPSPRALWCTRACSR